MSAELVHVPFHGGEILAIRTPMGEFVPVKPLCDDLGIDARSQRARIQRSAWGNKGGVMMTLPSAGGLQETFCLHRKRIAMWLATLDTERVREEVRPRLELLQNEAADVLDAYFTGKATSAPCPRCPQLDAQLRTLRPGPLRPTDIAAAWARAYLEAAPAPMALGDVWPHYVKWAQEAGQRTPASSTTLGMALRSIFHQQTFQGPVALGYRAAYYCALRAEPLQVDLPVQVQAQQELPLPAQAAQGDSAALRAEVRAYFLAQRQAKEGEALDAMPELIDRVTRVLERNELEAAHVAEVLAAEEHQVQAVLGAGVETGRFLARAKAGRLLYRQGATPEPMTDLQQQVKAFMEARPGNERVATREIIEGLGLEQSRANEVKVGMALRSLGYERIRHNDGSGWRRYSYVKPEDKN